MINFERRRIQIITDLIWSNIFEVTASAARWSFTSYKSIWNWTLPQIVPNNFENGKIFKIDEYIWMFQSREQTFSLLPFSTGHFFHVNTWHAVERSRSRSEVAPWNHSQTKSLVVGMCAVVCLVCVSEKYSFFKASNTNKFHCPILWNVWTFRISIPHFLRECWYILYISHRGSKTKYLANQIRFFSGAIYCHFWKIDSS